MGREQQDSAKGPGYERKQELSPADRIGCRSHVLPSWKSAYTITLNSNSHLHCKEALSMF